MNEFLILMKNELVVTVIIFVLLFIKIGKGMRNETLLALIQVMLMLNVLQGFFFNRTGVLFDGMFNTSSLIAFQKTILNISMHIHP